MSNIAFMPGWWSSWRARHRHPVSICLHVLAVPLLPGAGALAVIQVIDGAWNVWWRPVALVGISYTLQWIGHRVEGNDMGEVILIKKWMGRPYVAIAPVQTPQVAPTSDGLVGGESSSTGRR